MLEVREERGVVVARAGHETIRIEAWGPDAVRVRTTLGSEIVDSPASALLEPSPSGAEIQINDGSARLRNGELVVELAEIAVAAGEPFPPRIRFLRPNGEVLLSEAVPHFSSPAQRRYVPAAGDGFRCEVTFDPHDDERFYGLGQHQHGLLDQKGAVIDLVQRNTEVSIPFALSSRGYGLLWNMPGVGRVEFGANRTRWVADSAQQIDYWVTAARVPADIVRTYVRATGLPPRMPEWGTGFWQCKLRYRTQEELLEVAREYKRRGLPLSVIVIDYFHWSMQGDWRFDPAEWPDPQAMVDELRELGVELMVSIWPTVNPKSRNYEEMERRGLLIDSTCGLPLHLTFWDKGDDIGHTFVRYYDATNPQARRFVWDQVSEGYGRYGIRAFWLDACEPEMRPEDPGRNLLYLGKGDAVQSVYPREHARGFAEGLQAEGEEPLLLCRSAWAGSQRYGAAVWSGDIASTFEAFADQIPAGLNIAISGIPWWTTDIGGFHGGDPRTDYFRELVVRWFQFAVFCPIFRLHGIREPGELRGAVQTGAANEAWSFGDEAYGIISELLALRERLRPYVAAQMDTASGSGMPPLRALFLEFPDDPETWTISDEFLFGPDILVAPVTSYGARERRVYLPSGASWLDGWSGEPVERTGWIDARAPLDRIPVYLRQGGALASLAR
ncbi:MAG: family 31 glucosidase [Actinomycetota bacterium]|nr:family 31 glucosidase [Actinomycetota bacterium]